MFRLNIDSQNWFWNEGPAIEKQEQSSRFQKMYSKHGSSFLLPSIHEDYAFEKFSFTAAELDAFSNIVSSTFCVGMSK